MVAYSEADAQGQLDTLKVGRDDLPQGVLPFDALRWCPPDASRPGAAFPDARPQGGNPFTPCLPAFRVNPLAGGAKAATGGADAWAAPVEASDETLGGDSRQITPIFIPGIQDHYTGLRKLPASTEQKPPVWPAPEFLPPGLEETCKVQVEPVIDVEIARYDSKKLESLIWLYLHTNKGDEAPPSGTVETTDSASGSSVAAGRATPPTSEEEEQSSCPPPPANPPNAEFSCGSVGHPETCNEACKYTRKKRGCKDGLACSRCHLCTWYHKRNAKSGLAGHDESGTP